jgi:Haemolysin-type calcium binding protein related domain
VDTDKLLLTNLNAADVALLRFDDRDLFVKVLATGQMIQIRDFFKGDGSGIEVIRFADGTTWSRGDMLNRAEFVGDASTNGFFDMAGNDTIRGNAGRDAILLMRRGRAIEAAAEQAHRV